MPEWVVLLNKYPTHKIFSIAYTRAVYFEYQCKACPYLPKKIKSSATKELKRGQAFSIASLQQSSIVSLRNWKKAPTVFKNASSCHFSSQAAA